MKMWLTGNESRDAANAEFKRLGMNLIAFSENEALARISLRVFGFYPETAGKLLIETAEALGNGMSLGPRRSDILRFLRLRP